MLLAGVIRTHSSVRGHDTAGSHSQRQLHPCTFSTPSTAFTPGHGSGHGSSLTAWQVHMLTEFSFPCCHICLLCILHELVEPSPPDSA